MKKESIILVCRDKKNTGNNVVFAGQQTKKSVRAAIVRAQKRHGWKHVQAIKFFGYFNGKPLGLDFFTNEEVEWQSDFDQTIRVHAFKKGPVKDRPRLILDLSRYASYADAKARARQDAVDLVRDAMDFYGYDRDGCSHLALLWGEDENDGMENLIDDACLEINYLSDVEWNLKCKISDLQSCVRRARVAKNFKDVKVLSRKLAQANRDLVSHISRCDKIIAKRRSKNG